LTLHSTSQLSMKVIIQLQYSLSDSRVLHYVKNITQSSLHPTQPNPPKIALKNSDPTKPNPWTDSWPTMSSCIHSHSSLRRGKPCWIPLNVGTYLPQLFSIVYRGTFVHFVRFNLCRSRKDEWLDASRPIIIIIVVIITSSRNHFTVTSHGRRDARTSVTFIPLKMSEMSTLLLIMYIVRNLCSFRCTHFSPVRAPGLYKNRPVPFPGPMSYGTRRLNQALAALPVLSSGFMECVCCAVNVVQFLRSVILCCLCVLSLGCSC